MKDKDLKIGMKVKLNSHGIRKIGKYRQGVHTIKKIRTHTDGGIDCHPDHKNFVITDKDRGGIWSCFIDPIKPKKKRGGKK